MHAGTLYGYITCFCHMHATTFAPRPHRSYNHAHVHVIQVVPRYTTIHQGLIQLLNTAEQCALHAMACRACVHIAHAMRAVWWVWPRFCRFDPCTHSRITTHICIRAAVSIISMIGTSSGSPGSHIPASRCPSVRSPKSLLFRLHRCTAR